MDSTDYRILKMALKPKKGYCFFPLFIIFSEKSIHSKNIDFDDNLFDAVILFAVLTCITFDTEQLDLVREIKRILKPGGYVYINDFLLNSDERNLMRYAAYEKKYGYGTFELSEGAVLRHHDINYIKSLLIPFAKCKMEEVTFKTMNGNQSKGFCYIGRKE